MELNQFITLAASYAVSITAICGAITALVALFVKPARKFIGKIFVVRNGQKKLQESMTALTEEVKSIKTDLAEAKEADKIRDNELKGVKDDIAALSGQIQRVSEENDDNERSRIRRDIMKYGMIARKKGQISEKEFESIRLDYEKYHGPLHGNGIVTEEYEFVRDYYNAHYAEWK